MFQFVQKAVGLILYILTKVFGFIPSIIYGYIYSRYFTLATYRQIGERAKLKGQVRNVLDIGTATGNPLHSIVDSFGNAKVLGIDINTAYIDSCRRLFADRSNVTIEHLNFYDIEKKHGDTQFDIVIFGSSLMLMPDQTKAMEITRRIIAPGGRVYFLLTLYEEKNAYSKFWKIFKPYLKYLTTVDFGQLTYADDFKSFLVGHGLHTVFSERCSGNFWLKLVKFYIYEVEFERQIE